MRKRLVRKMVVAAILAGCIALVPFAAAPQTDEGLVVGTIFNDTDLLPTSQGPVVLNIVVDRNFMGRVEPGESLDVALAPRLEPYEVRAYVFNYDGSSFFAVVDLPLSYTVVVPISHRGRISPFWVAFEGIH